MPPPRTTIQRTSLFRADAETGAYRLSMGYNIRYENGPKEKRYSNAIPARRIFLLPRFTNVPTSNKTSTSDKGKKSRLNSFLRINIARVSGLLAG
jgi:hypothetical protein